MTKIEKAVAPARPRTMRAVTLIVTALCCIWTTMPHAASAFVRGSSWHHQLQAGTRAQIGRARVGQECVR